MDLTYTRVGSLLLIPNGPAMDKARSDVIGAAVEDCVNKSPIVQGSDLRLPCNPGWSENLDLSSRSFQYMEPLKFRARWPTKNQEMNEGTDIEDFELWYDGFIYMITVSLEQPLRPGVGFSLGREGHRILNQILGESDLWTLEHNGPTPMEPAFYVAVCEDASAFSFGRNLVQRTHCHERVLALDESSDSTRERVLHLLRGPAWAHYRCLLTRKSVLDHQVALYKAASDATTIYRDAPSARTWDPRTWLPKFRVRRGLGNALADAYQEYLVVQEMRTELARDAGDVDRMFAEHPLLQHDLGYTLATIADIADWDGSALLETLRFVAEESRSRSLLSATYVGPLAGAIIGALATAVAFLISR